MNVVATVEALASRRRFSSNQVESRFRRDMTEFLLNLCAKSVWASPQPVEVCSQEEEYEEMPVAQ